MSTKYIFKHFAFGHNDDGGYSIYRDESDICDAFHDQATAYAVWAKKERKVLNSTFPYIDFENTAADFFSWLAEQFNMVFNERIDFNLWLQNHDYVTWMNQMPDEVLLTFLQKLGANRFVVEECSQEKIETPLYVVVYPGGAMYVRAERYLDDGVIYQTADLETFYQADKFNQAFDIANADDYPFYGIYIEKDEQNQALQTILQQYPHRFRMACSEITFVGNYCDYYTQEELDALHQVNRLLKMFTIQTMHYPHYS